MSHDKGWTKWTITEDNILREYYESEGGAIKKRLPNRSIDSIHKRASRLDISATRKTYKRLRHVGDWSKEDDAIIIKYYPREGTKCRDRLSYPRTNKAIYGRCMTLGVRRNAKKG